MRTTVYTKTYDLTTHLNTTNQKANKNVTNEPIRTLHMRLGKESQDNQTVIKLKNKRPNVTTVFVSLLTI